MADVGSIVVFFLIFSDTSLIVTSRAFLSRIIRILTTTITIKANTSPLHNNISRAYGGTCHRACHNIYGRLQ